MTPAEKRSIMSERHQRKHAQAGDWLEVNGIPGYAARRGEILEILGRPGHEHYRVHWDEQHESLHFPAQGTTVIRHGASRSRPRA